MQADEVTFDSKSSKLSKQNHIIEQIVENGSVQYNCTACRKTFRSRSQKYYHINCNQLQNLIYKCEHCEKSFARRTQLKYHTESHISPVNKCDKCQKTFANPLALKKHITLHKVEPKICPHCDKTFKKKISLDQHIFAQHLNRLQYGCAHCNKKYASKSTLQMHLQTHEKKRFECTLCGKLFQRNSILKSHIKRHNNTNSYTCAICEKTFSESGALARHSKLHQESVLQYYCKICEKSMLRKDNMTRHLTTIHPEKMFDEVVKIIKPPSRQQTAESEVCENFNGTKNNVLILENKLLCEPFVVKESLNNLPQMCAKTVNAEVCPVVNQIKVITSVPTSKNEICAKNCLQKHSHEFRITNESRKTDTMTDTHKVADKTTYKVIEEDVISGEKRSLINSNFNKSIYQSKEQQLENFQPENNEEKLLDITFCNEQNSAEKVTVVQQHFSSVIKSVGNVKKDLLSNDLLSVNTNNQVSVEYKHKKYCRNNYNIDLYRRILGFDEDDENENVQKPQKYDREQKSSTPLHWRKCFKNNYETSGS